MLASLAMFASAVIIGTLGSVHLVYTFVGVKLHPRDPRLIRRMQQTSMVLTRDTSVWRAWIGFNAIGGVLSNSPALVTRVRSTSRTDLIVTMKEEREFGAFFETLWWKQYPKPAP